MNRTTEQIQHDISHTAWQIQELRREQGPTRDDRLSIARRIYQLTARLDALYAEKRLVQCSPAIMSLPDAEDPQTSKAADRLVALVFGAEQPPP